MVVVLVVFDDSMKEVLVFVNKIVYNIILVCMGCCIYLLFW